MSRKIQLTKALRVGPQSAGANPGPACYRRGGPLAKQLQGRRLAQRLFHHRRGVDEHLELARLPLDQLNVALDRMASGAATFEGTLKSLARRGFEIAEVGWILEGNSGMRNIIETTGGVVYKRYHVYQKML